MDATTRCDGPRPQALTRREIVAALLGDSQPEPDAPVRTTHQLAAAVPVSTEIAADTGLDDADLEAALDLDDASDPKRERFEAALRRQLSAVLEDHAVADIVKVAIDGARVELSGWVPDVLTLQLVEDLAWSVPAVRQCENRMRIGSL